MTKKKLDLLSQTQAAERLGLSRQRISTLIGVGKIKPVIIAGRPHISEKELDRFAAIPRRGGRPASKQ